MTTIITNANLRQLVLKYVSNKKELPDDLKGVPIGQWDVSRVTNMQNMFLGRYTFNEPLDTWDVSNVTNMDGMFYRCKEFNQPLNAWNVSNVTSMMGMFSGCSAFDQPLNAWNVSNVTKMESMFDDCPIRDSYKPGAAPEVTPTTARRTLRQFYQAHHRQLPTNLAEKCNRETDCPITYMSLKRLRDMKRLVVLDGRCYAFYAFIQEDPPLTNPFTRQPWSAQAKADIAVIRKYKDFLKAEYEGLPEKTPTPRRTRRGRTARQRQQPTSTRKSRTRKSRTRKSRTP